MIFALDPRLASDTFEIGDLGLSRALLMNDARYPWVILAPRRQGAADISDLASADRAALIEEVARACEIVRALPDVEKVNVGALGNIVRQLHIHIVGRNARDFAWPGPVWGAGLSRAYQALEREALLARLKDDFSAVAAVGKRLAAPTPLPTSASIFPWPRPSSPAPSSRRPSSAPPSWRRSCARCSSALRPGRAWC